MNSEFTLSSKQWERVGFRHLSFESCTSPYISYAVNIGSEYAAPELLDYSFNSHNFRSDEFHEGTNILALGCSHTLGIGVPENLTWPSFVKELTGIDDVVNLGKTGASIALQVGYLTTYIRTYGPPKIVLCNFPEILRYQHITESGEIVEGSAYSGMTDNSYTKEQAATQSILALATLEAICKANQIVLRWQMWSSHESEEYIEYKLAENFDYYVQNKYTEKYLAINDPHVDVETNELMGEHSHETWGEECCSDLRKRSNGCFNYGHDRYSVPKKHQKRNLIIDQKERNELKKSTFFVHNGKSIAHLGSHAHWHWAKNLVDSL
jgi:hypothetical protein